MTDKEYYLDFWGYELGTPEAEAAWDAKCRMNEPKQAHYVMGDIQPYRSMVDGQMIESRSKHRAHLKQHGVIEVGNETHHLKPKAYQPPPGLKERLIHEVNQRIK
jgi:hypothetical protein